MAELRRSAAAVATAVVLILLSACGQTGSANGVVADVRTQDEDGLHGAVLTTPYRLGQSILTDSAGQPFQVRSELEKPLTLAFFGYTKCPDICQVVMADLASAVARLSSEQADRVATWFVTTDPARDDPETLRSYLDRFNPAFEGLTGPLEDIVDLAGTVHIPVEKGPRLPSGGYEVVHGTQILGITPDGEVPVLWTEGTSAAKLAEDIDKILRDGVPTIDGNG